MAGSRMPEALASLFAVLDEMEIRYFAGGSVASSIHGIARYTQDVDIVADLAPEHMEGLPQGLSCTNAAARRLSASGAMCSEL